MQLDIVQVTSSHGPLYVSGHREHTDTASDNEEKFVEGCLQGRELCYSSDVLFLEFYS